MYCVKTIRYEMYIVRILHESEVRIGNTVMRVNV